MTVRLLVGDALARLAEVDDRSVQCVVTSPPYFGLRSYLPDGHPDKAREIGAETTPDAYIAALVAVFRAVRRLLADDGTVWLNIGDSYAGAQVSRFGSGDRETRRAASPAKALAAGYKPKDLLMIPARVALALQADSWWLRSEIIWAKRNPMPESVKDRPTCAHEKVFLLAKRARYFYDAEAIREAPTYSLPTGIKDGVRRVRNIGGRTDGFTRLITPGGVGCPVGGRNARNVWTIALQPYKGAHYAVMPSAIAERCIKAGSRVGDIVLDPFCGTGTVPLVALGLGRRAIGIDLDPASIALAEERLRDVGDPIQSAAE